MNLSAGQELHWDASLNPAALGNGALAFPMTTQTA